MCFFFNDTATAEIYTLSLHDALPIFRMRLHEQRLEDAFVRLDLPLQLLVLFRPKSGLAVVWDHLRSEEHTSELQSRQYLVCRLLLEKKKHRYICRAAPTEQPCRHRLT